MKRSEEIKNVNYALFSQTVALWDKISCALLWGYLIACGWQDTHFCQMLRTVMQMCSTCTLLLYEVCHFYAVQVMDTCGPRRILVNINMYLTNAGFKINTKIWFANVLWGMFSTFVIAKGYTQCVLVRNTKCKQTGTPQGIFRPLLTILKYDENGPGRNPCVWWVFKNQWSVYNQFREKEHQNWWVTQDVLGHFHRDNERERLRQSETVFLWLIMSELPAKPSSSQNDKGDKE